MKGHRGTIIVGQGLAGCILAWRLKQAGEPFTIIDDCGPAASSRIAAGMINPLAGRRLALHPDTSSYLHSAKRLYRELGNLAGKSLYEELPIYRYFQNDIEVKRYHERRSHPEYKPYLGEALSQGCGFVTLGGGRLHVPGLLDSLSALLRSNGTLLQERFDFERLAILQSGLRYRDIEARQIVFCEGWRGSLNPWFQGLPWDPVKGEILSLKLPDYDTGQILNRGKWVVPAKRGTFRAGATYQRDVLDDNVSEAAKDEILSGVAPLLGGQEVQVTGHGAGIRPGTRTQRPFIGRHPEHENIAIFNGFGSKGSFLIPHLSEIFCDHLLHASTLPTTLGIQSLWTKSSTSQQSP